MRGRLNAVLQRVTDATEGLRIEQNLFAAEGSQFRMWTTRKPALVCPRAYEQRSDFDRAQRRSFARGWPVHLRPTGGGTVMQGAGVSNLVLAFNAPMYATIEDCYRLLIQIIKCGIGAFGTVLKTGHVPGSTCDGAWNLSFEGRKIVGTAQRWRPVRGSHPRVLAHALILTSDLFRDGIKATAAFHHDLGLGPITPEAHISTEKAFGFTNLPVAALYRAADQALSAFSVQDF